MIATEPKTPQRRFADTPSDKPMGERTEHANLDRPGAQAHPKAVGRDWSDYAQRVPTWRMH